MGKKMIEAKKFRAENGKKWANYTGPFTPEIIMQMQEDNKKVLALCREATKEWLEENKKNA